MARNSREIGRFLCVFVPKSPVKFDFFFRNLSEALIMAYSSLLPIQGAKEVIFKACHSGKLKLAYTSPNIISTSPMNILMSRIDFTVLL